MLEFIGNDIVLGHNVPFDARFLDAAYSEIGKSFEENGKAKIGKIGDADSRLMSQREIVDFAVDWIEKNRV